MVLPMPSQRDQVVGARWDAPTAPATGTWRGSAAACWRAGGGRRPAWRPQYRLLTMRPCGARPLNRGKVGRLSVRRCGRARGGGRTRGRRRIFGTGAAFRFGGLDRFSGGGGARLSCLFTRYLDSVQFFRFWRHFVSAGGVSALGDVAASPFPLSTARWGVLTFTPSVPAGDEDGVNHALIDRFDLHRGLVGLDLGDHVRRRR